MLLLDTCTLIWLIGDENLLSSAAKSSMYWHADSLFVSSVTAFELGKLAKKNKISLSCAPQRWFYEALQEKNIKEIPLSSDIIFLAEGLPDLHNDPMDRFIIATGLRYGFSIVTPDQWITRYPSVKVIW